MCITAKFPARRQLRVKSGKPQIEHNTSGLPRKQTVLHSQNQRSNAAFCQAGGDCLDAHAGGHQPASSLTECRRRRRSGSGRRQTIVVSSFAARHPSHVPTASGTEPRPTTRNLLPLSSSLCGLLPVHDFGLRPARDPTTYSPGHRRLSGRSDYLWPRRQCEVGHSQNIRFGSA